VRLELDYPRPVGVDMIEIAGEGARSTACEEGLRVIRIYGQRQSEVGDRPLIVLPRDHRDAPMIEDVRVGRPERQRLRVVRDRAVQVAETRANGAAVRVRGDRR